MRFNCNKTVLVLGTLGALASGVASATYSNNGCNMTTGCDSWGEAKIYNMYQDLGDDDDYSSGINLNGITVNVSAWSDVGNYNGSWRHHGTDVDGSDYYINSGHGWYQEEDDTVQSAEFAGPWWEGPQVGYGMYSGDAGENHTIDNFSHEYGGTDYDMVLLSFSEEVSLAGATFSYVDGYASKNQVTVAGLSDTGLGQLTSGSATWGDIAATVGGSLKNSFQIGSDNGTYYSDFTFTETSKYWLVGAYNTAFGFVDGFGQNNDGFKLSSIGFNKIEEDNNENPDPVNAPSSFALLLLAGGFAAWRRKQVK
jgi:hypothetical protein